MQHQIIQLKIDELRNKLETTETNLKTAKTELENANKLNESMKNEIDKINKENLVQLHALEHKIKELESYKMTIMLNNSRDKQKKEEEEKRIINEYKLKLEERDDKIQTYEQQIKTLTNNKNRTFRRAEKITERRTTKPFKGYG